MADASFQKKNVIVTGGAGFIGSHLCEALLQEGRVICIDNLSGGSIANIEHLLAHPDFIFIKHDVSEPLDLESVPEVARFKIPFQGIQELYHLACPMSVNHFAEERLQTIFANSAAVRHTLEWAVRYKARYIFTSSAVVYGARTGAEPITEDTVGQIDQLSARAAYDEGKRFAETTIGAYQSLLGVDARIARIFRVYGPRLKLFDGQLITDFVQQALTNETVAIAAPESYRTTLLYVSDAVSAIMKLAKAPPGMQPINIGAEEEFTYGEIVQKIITLAQSSSQVSYVEPLPYGFELPVPNISRAKQELGWMPLMRLENGLQHTVDYVTANRYRLG